jgi:hypothetical protein
MQESRELAAARVSMAEAEAAWTSSDGLARLIEGLGRLADIIDAGRDARGRATQGAVADAGRDARGRATQGAVAEAGAKPEVRTASNLAATYAGRFYGRVRDKLERDAQVPEPELEHCFKVVLAFDQVKDSLPAAAAELKIDVVKALIERYYEGHSPEKKRAVLEQLAALRPSR